MIYSFGIAACSKEEFIVLSC